MELSRINSNTKAISIIVDGKETEEFDFPPTVPSRPITKTIALRNNVGEDIIIENITVDNPKLNIINN